MICFIVMIVCLLLVGMFEFEILNVDSVFFFVCSGVGRDNFVLDLFLVVWSIIFFFFCGVDYICW